MVRHSRRNSDCGNSKRTQLFDSRYLGETYQIVALGSGRVKKGRSCEPLRRLMHDHRGRLAGRMSGAERTNWVRYPTLCTPGRLGGMTYIANFEVRSDNSVPWFAPVKWPSWTP